ncbi:MAG: flagellar basal body rod protein FlgC [Desulfobacterales bacterium]
MNFLTSLKISAMGMRAQRKRMDIIASNLANIETTRTGKGGPYRRKIVVMGTKSIENFDSVLDSQIQGPEIEAVVEDQSPFRKTYNPSHPDADENGYLLKPNIDLVVEMTSMMMARKTYEANISAMKTTRTMILKALEILK